MTKLDESLSQQEATTYQSQQLIPIPSTTSRALIHYQGPPEPRKPFRLPLIAVLFVLEVFLGSVALVLSGSLLPQKSATITITPRTLVEQQVISLYAGTGPTAGHKIEIHLLTATSPPSTTTTPATGAIEQPALAAHGTLTFYNLAPYTQTVAAGTIVTAKNGLEVITLTQAVIPPGTGPLQGSDSVPAQVKQVGSSGNLPAGAVDVECCSNGILATNQQAFAEGQDAATLTVVQQHDIDSAAAPLVEQATRTAQDVLQAHIGPGELLAASSSCVPRVQANTGAGSHASRVTVTVTATCRGEVYTGDAAHQMATDLYTKQITSSLGPSYTLAGSAKIGSGYVIAQDTHHDTLTIAFIVRGVWVYHLNRTDLQQFLPQIAGLSREAALSRLLRFPGIAKVTITGNFGNALPTERSRIILAFQNPSL